MWYYLYFILLLGPRIVGGQWGGALCIDCRNQNREICDIESDSGWSCGTEESIYQNEYREHSGPHISSNMSTCIPPGLDVTDPRAGELVICCVWSRQLGCQVIVPTASYTPTNCSSCYASGVSMFKNLSPCPCVDSSSDRSHYQESKRPRLLYMIIGPFCIFYGSNWS